MQITDTVYPMYKAYIEPDLNTAHLKIYNNFNPFSGFMAPTYILKSAKPVLPEQIKAVLKVRMLSSQSIDELTKYSCCSCVNGFTCTLCNCRALSLEHHCRWAHTVKGGTFSCVGLRKKVLSITFTPFSCSADEHFAALTRRPITCTKRTAIPMTYTFSRLARMWRHAPHGCACEIGMGATTSCLRNGSLMDPSSSPLVSPSRSVQLASCQMPEHLCHLLVHISLFTSQSLD